MSKTNAFENELSEYIFAERDITDIGDATGLVSPISTGGYIYVWIRLYTVAPTETSIGTECSYLNYAAKAVYIDGATTGYWTVTGDTVENHDAVTFPTAGTGANEVAVAMAITGVSASEVMYFNTLDSSITITAGITPTFSAGDIVLEDN